VAACCEPHHAHSENRQVLPEGLDAVRLGRLAVGRIARVDPFQAFSRDCGDPEIFHETSLVLLVGQVYRVGHHRDHCGYYGNLVRSGVAWVAGHYLATEELRIPDVEEAAKRCRCVQSHS